MADDGGGGASLARGPEQLVEQANGERVSSPFSRMSFARAARAIGRSKEDMLIRKIDRGKRIAR